ncbi:MAG: tRNA epoxyqueuosine(34) reductase QueG [Oligoflexus sp.]|nr:tRNA epoxyqueuosine(34) reductase QueG [Pseudopedobacter sp.]
MLNSKNKYTEIIKAEGKRLGFSFCGVSKAGFLEEEAPRLENWLNKNYNGKMDYMDNHFDKRLDPRLLVENAKSVISLSLNYFTEEAQTDTNAPKISKYAFGKDYHFVIKDKLKHLLYFIEENIGEVNGRAFVDSAPVLDKSWAKKAGLGWIGKNTNLISKDSGSFFFIAELIVDLELNYDNAFEEDFCGTCTKCIDACPTDAIIAPYIVDGSRCISYLTIELKEQIPDEFKGKMDNWAFGCDVCQDVCPWNRFAVPHQNEEFKPRPDLLNLNKKDWEEITSEIFSEVFKKSALKRTKLEGLKRNISFLKPV